MSITIVILFVFFIVLGFILFFINSRNRVIVFLFLFLFLIFLDFIFVFYSLSYIISHLDFSGNSSLFNQYFTFLIILSSSQACLLVFFYIFGTHFLYYSFFSHTDSKTVSGGLDKVVSDLVTVDWDKDLEYSLGERYVINYAIVSDIVLSNTKCFGCGNGSINFFHPGCFDDFFLALGVVHINYYKANNNTYLHLYDYSIFIYDGIVKVLGKGLISYEYFIEVFVLYAKGIFHNCFIISGIYFYKAELNLNVQFWLDSLDSDGKFLDSFLQNVSNNSHIYKSSSFDFSLEVYDVNKVSHSSSNLVPYSTLFSDLEFLKTNSKSYNSKARLFPTVSFRSLKSSDSFLAKGNWKSVSKSYKYRCEYQIFLKHCRRP